MKIWVDADACPKVIKEILFRAAQREQLDLTLVANQALNFPSSTFISSIQVRSGFDEADDEIPFTVLNICHKNEVSRRRCFLYSYQITILVRDSKKNNIYPLVEPKVYAKIRFISMNQKMIILPGD